MLSSAADATIAHLDYETLQSEQDGHVVVLTYNRPEARNAVSVQMNEELHHAWQRFRDDARALQPSPGGVLVAWRT